MKVSIVVTTYNRNDMVRECIESVKKQTYEDIELIVVDDGSASPVPDAIRIDHAGPVEAMNVGTVASTGDAIIRLDDDDMITPNYVKVCVEGLEKGYDIAGKGNMSSDLLKHNTTHGTSAYLRKWFDKVGQYRRPLGSPAFLDWYFWLRCWDLGATCYDITADLEAIGEVGHIIRKGHPRISDCFETNSAAYILYRKLLINDWKNWREGRTDCLDLGEIPPSV